jgi:hypothetical protein
MGLDKVRNIVMCLMTNGAILCIQLIENNIRKSTVIEKVVNYE